MGCELASGCTRSSLNRYIVPDPLEQFVVARRFSAVATQGNVLQAFAFLTPGLLR